MDCNKKRNKENFIEVEDFKLISDRFGVEATLLCPFFDFLFLMKLGGSKILLRCLVLHEKNRTISITRGVEGPKIVT